MRRVEHPRFVAALRAAGLRSIGDWSRRAGVSWAMMMIYRHGKISSAGLERLSAAIGLPAEVTREIIRLPLKRLARREAA
jgi:hypothetical protein